LTNALDLIPAFRRQIGIYTQGQNHTDSALAGYIADAVQALMYKWEREYTIEFTSPATYVITPDVEQRDIRPIILMASIIYKMGTIGLVSFIDGDFSYNPHKGAGNAIESDRLELQSYVHSGVRLAAPSVGAFLGFDNWVNPESYIWAAISYV
jgi:hypothetical protein